MQEGMPAGRAKTRNHPNGWFFVLVCPDGQIRNAFKVCLELGSQVKRKPLSACKQKAGFNSLLTAMHPAFVFRTVEDAGPYKYTVAKKAPLNEVNPI